MTAVWTCEKGIKLSFQKLQNIFRNIFEKYATWVYNGLGTAQ
jgi:hypothetical protein